MHVDPNKGRFEKVCDGILLSNETLIFCTFEKITLSSKIAALGFCRSTLAKVPILVHVPGLIDPGFSGVLSGFIHNFSNTTIAIPEKFRIFQLLFFEVNGKDDYSKRELSKNYMIDNTSFFKVKLDKEWRK